MLGMQKLKLVLASLASFILLGVPALAAVPAAYADTNIGGSLCQSTTDFKISEQPGSTGSCGTADGVNQINGLLTKAVNVFSAVVGVIAVLMIIVGGLRYITSGGDTGKVSAAKTTIIYALVGLVVVALAQLIVHFVLNQANSFAGS